MVRSTAILLSLFIINGMLIHPSVAQEPEAAPAAAAEPVQPAAGAEQKPAVRDVRLANILNGCKFIGTFTIDGGGESKNETYTISKCEKLPEGDLFRLTARIQYGDTDAEVPLDLPIRWSGNTPVITLDSFWIPGMGTFSSRVLIHGNRYAGTWQHDDKGGHMFGRIEKIEKDEASK